MTHYVSHDGFVKWLAGLTGQGVFIPEPTARGSWVRRLQAELLTAPARQPATAHLGGPGGGAVASPALDRPRASQSAKGFFMPPAETLGRYGENAGPAVAVAEEPVVIVGVRACELRAWRYLDKVMLEGPFVDPMYKARREAATIIATDCVQCAPTCCCTLVDGRPFVESGDGADINVTPLADGYVLDVLTEKGRALVGGANWPEASAEQLAGRQTARQQMVEQLNKQNAEFSYRATDEKPPDLPEMEHEAWQRFAADCVECGACTNICPTCYCFYLFDHITNPGSAERVRTWDSCLLATYHRMAGGVAMKLTPRPELRNRLANRILHKFVYSPQQYGMLGCVGCGRCVDACLGAIDIRKAVEGLKR